MVAQFGDLLPTVLVGPARSMFENDRRPLAVQFVLKIDTI
jgi:hypothetical protein